MTWNAVPALDVVVRSVEMVIMIAVTSGSIHLPTSSARGHDAQPDLFATLELAEAVVDSAWSSVIACYVRQVPALRFDTLHGSVVVRICGATRSTGRCAGSRPDLRCASTHRSWRAPNEWRRCGPCGASARAVLRAVVAAFLRESDPTVVSAADGRFQAARRRIEGNDGEDVDAGIAAMESYLDGQRSTGLED